MYILFVYKKELLKNDYLKTLLITISYYYYYYCYYYYYIIRKGIIIIAINSTSNKSFILLTFKVELLQGRK